jgi:uncharacterized protein
LQLAKESTEANLIGAWEEGRVRVGGEWYQRHLIVTASEVVADWRVDDPRTLGVDQLAPAIELEPEIVLLGTGIDTVLPDVQLMAALAEQRIGLEIMTTPSACRTFNVLVHEGRRVAAALFISALGAGHR